MAARALDLDDPNRAMPNHLLKVRRSGPNSYRMILNSIGDRTKLSRLSVLQKSELIKATKSHSRIRQMRNAEGLRMCDEEDFFPLEVSWKRKYAQKQFKKV